jgi:hypothetical protein
MAPGAMEIRLAGVMGRDSTMLATMIRRGIVLISGQKGGNTIQY